MQFLETSSEVKFKVTETQLWYLTLCHPKMHLHTNFEIPTSNNIRDMLRTRLLKKTRSEVKVTMTCKWYVTLCHPKKHIHTNFGISDLKEYRRYAPDSMQFLKTRSEVKFKVTVTQLWYETLYHPKMHPHYKLEIPTSKNIRDMFRTRLF